MQEYYSYLEIYYGKHTLVESITGKSVGCIVDGIGGVGGASVDENGE